MLLFENANMEQNAPENLSNKCELKVPSRIDKEPATSFLDNKFLHSDMPPPKAATKESSIASTSQHCTKVKLSFSVDRLLNSDRAISEKSLVTERCCDSNIYSCCTFPNCTDRSKITQDPVTAVADGAEQAYACVALDKLYPSLYMDYKSVLRPIPIRAVGTSSEHATPFPTLATSALLRFHHQQNQQQQLQNKPTTTPSGMLLAPFNSLKSLQVTHEHRFLHKSQQLQDIPIAQERAVATGASTTKVANVNIGHSSSSGARAGHSNNTKRKRSWSRAVFTNLQRKGLEIQFQQQKYITKPDRRKLAARLNLTDAQVKVWFQNRRMKWRHTRENLKSGQEKPPIVARSGAVGVCAASPTKAAPKICEVPHNGLLDSSSESFSSMDLSDQEDNMEIDVVE